MLNRRTFLQQSLCAACSVAAASSLTRITSAQNDAHKVAPFGDIIAISGNARERGRQYGQHFSDGIHEFLGREIYTAFDGQPSKKEDLLRYAGACAKVIRTECPVIADELEGMAEGSGLRLEEHVLLTLHEELYHRGVLPPVPHCTAVAVGKPETRNGIAYVGQTWDWMPSVAGMSTMLEWRRSDGPSVLAYAFPGLWVGAGLNANGLALCWTSAELGVRGAGAARGAAELRAVGASAVSGEPGCRAGSGAPQCACGVVHVCHGRRQRPTHERGGFTPGHRSGGGHGSTDSRGLRHAADESDEGGSGGAATSALPGHGHAAQRRLRTESTWRPCSARSASRAVESVSARTRLT